jgi:hypothetical protein
MGYIIGMDVSTKTIGVSLFEDKGESGKLLELTHVTPKIKPKPENSLELMMKKVETFEKEFLHKYSDLEISKVFIEEPLLRSNNVNTVGTLLRFNGMICRAVYDVLNIVPEFVSSYDARKYAFPELMAKRRKMVHHLLKMLLQKIMKYYLVDILLILIRKWLFGKRFQIGNLRLYGYMIRI